MNLLHDDDDDDDDKRWWCNLLMSAFYYWDKATRADVQNRKDQNRTEQKKRKEWEGVCEEGSKKKKEKGSVSLSTRRTRAPIACLPASPYSFYSFVCSTVVVSTKHTRSTRHLDGMKRKPPPSLSFLPLLLFEVCQTDVIWQQLHSRELHSRVFAKGREGGSEWVR